MHPFQSTLLTDLDLRKQQGQELVLALSKDQLFYENTQGRMKVRIARNPKFAKSLKGIVSVASVHDQAEVSAV